MKIQLSKVNFLATPTTIQMLRPLNLQKKYFDNASVGTIIAHNINMTSGDGFVSYEDSIIDDLNAADEILNKPGPQIQAAESATESAVTGLIADIKHGRAKESTRTCSGYNS